jgi:hypothetical protein
VPKSWSVAAFFLAALLSAPAQACRMSAQLVLDDVKFADVVLVGRITNYTIVRDNAQRLRMLSLPNLPPDMRKLYQDPKQSLIWDYARFDVQVDEVLSGKAPRRLSVTWDNSTFGEPSELPSGPFLMALRDPSSRTPPLRGPSATIQPAREPGRLTLLQAPCASPFLFESISDNARAIRQLLKAQLRRR